MKRYLNGDGAGILWPLAFLFFLGSCFAPVCAWSAADSSGLAMSLYTDRQDPKYILGDSIKLFMAINNVSRWPIHTDRGFSQGEEFHRSLVVTDPSGNKHKPNLETTSSSMPPPVVWNGHPVLPAETLGVGWIKAVEIPDLGELFPMMKRVPGVYMIEAEQPFVRYAWTVNVDPFGLMGVADDKRNWYGTVVSESKIRITVTPPLGAQFKVLVEDLTSGSAQPVQMRLVKVFRNSDVVEAIGTGYALADAWKKVEPVITGRTNFSGYVVWDQGAPCMPEPAAGDAYVAIAQYKGEYELALFDPGGMDAGWKPDCGGLIFRRILFGEEPEKYSVYGIRSVWVRNKVVVHGGNVGAPTVTSGLELAVDEHVFMADEVKIIGDSVQLRSTASVYCVVYNDLVNLGAEIREPACSCSPLAQCDLPNWQLPEFLSSSPSNVDQLVGSGQTLILGAGNYRDITLSSGAILKLTGGIYHFRNLTLGTGSSLICEKTTQLRIEGRLSTGSKVYLGPYPVAPPPAPEQPVGGLRARDVKVYIAGRDDKKKGIAAAIGEGNIIRANLLAPNGSLAIEEGCRIEGSFIAKDVIIGQKTEVHLDYGF